MFSHGSLLSREPGNLPVGSAFVLIKHSAEVYDWFPGDAAVIKVGKQQMYVEQAWRGLISAELHSRAGWQGWARETEWS